MHVTRTKGQKTYAKNPTMLGRGKIKLQHPVTIK